MNKIKELEKEIKNLMLQNINIRNSLSGASNREFDYLSNLQEKILEKLDKKQKELKDLQK